MNKNIGFQLLIFGLVIAGLSYLTYDLAPAVSLPTLIAGLAGGALCVIWGLRAVTGSKGKGLALLTLIPMNFVLLSQTITWWFGGSEGMKGIRPGAAMTTVLFTLSVAMLMRIAWAGLAGEGQAPTPQKDATSKSQLEGKPGAQGNVRKS